MKQKKKSKKVIGKVNPLLYGAVYLALKGSYTRKYGITFDKKAVKDIKGPAVIIASHTCDVDHILSALTLYPVRPTYIVSEHFMHNPSTAKLLKHMHVITKKMFTPDVSTIMNILRAKRENAVIVIFPEGRLSCYAHTLPVADGTAELIKKLGVDLYIWKAEGASLTFPKWRDKGDSRRGRINASVKLLMSADEVKTCDTAKIKSIAEAAILHDDEMAMEGIEYRSDAIAQGVDRILFKCPNCMQEGTITAEGDHIRCTCGLDATLDAFYRLHNAPFSRLNAWFEWQQASIDTENEVLTSRARLGCCGADGFMDADAGEGEIYLDKDVFRLSGTLHGETVEFSVDSQKIGAFPITPGDHFDIYHNGRLIYVSPLPDGRATVKWTCFLDRLNEVRRAEKKDCSDAPKDVM
jgi:1-acyl-sn-glycerol-3-phosphate acyltransferase